MVGINKQEMKTQTQQPLASSKKQRIPYFPRMFPTLALRMLRAIVFVNAFPIY